MAADKSTLTVNSRESEGSRAARRLRRAGRVPGVLYGGNGEPLSFDVDARDLRIALAASGAVLDLSIDGAKASPVVLKEAQRDPVRGDTTACGPTACEPRYCDPRRGEPRAAWCRGGSGR